MHTFPGFELLDEASPGRLYTTYRAIRRSDGSAVFIKCSYMDGHGRGGLSSLRREYEVLKRLREYPVVQPLGFEPCEGGAILILERNPQMESLASCFQRRGALGLDTCLRMGVEIAKALVGVHAAGILHNSLSLDSVVVSQEGDFARLARFSRACEGPYRESSRENGCTDNYFLAPERLPGCQRRVDGRSDLYAVGCILYNLLAGRPPFAANSRASLRHAQRVLAPVPLSVHRPGLMPCVIDIVHTLLLKDPGARLPDAKSLARDLAACREQQGRSGAALPAATQASRKPLPWVDEPLIGRESQVSQIISSLRRCRTKRSMEVVMVMGSGGSGKTRLIHEVAQTAGSGAATVVTHRCCSIGSDRPWSAVFPLLDQLLQRNIESFPERRSKLIECRSKLFEALGPCVGIPQRAPSNRTPSAVRQRIFELIGELVSECSRARMCVLVLDDIHYADSTSLAVLGQLNRHGPRNRVVLIASYLSESGQERRLHRIFATRPVVRIEVGKISVAKWLPALPTEIRGSLSKRLLPLTIRLLGAGKGVGTRAQPTLEDPLEYLAARGANLSTEAKLCIRSMAECEYTCLSPLKKRVLCSLLKCEPVALESTLQTAVALGMVERGSMWEHGQSVVWQPCIRRWLGSGLKRRHRRRLHQMLAWEYYQQVATYKYAWIEAAVHLLHVGKALHSEMSNLDATRIFLNAAIVSLASGAVEEALRFLRQGMQHMPGEIWVLDEHLARKLYQHVIETESRYGDARRAKACSDRYAHGAHEPERRLHALRLRVWVETCAGRYRAAYSSAVVACREFGVDLPTPRGSRRRLRRSLRSESVFDYTQLCGQERPSKRMDELIRLVAESVQPALAVNHWLGVEVLLVLLRLIRKHGTNAFVHLACAGHVVATVVLNGPSHERLEQASRVWAALDEQPEDIRALARSILLKWVFCWEWDQTRQVREAMSLASLNEHASEQLPLLGEQLATCIVTGTLSVTEVEARLAVVARDSFVPEPGGAIRALVCLCRSLHGESSALAELTKHPEAVAKDALSSELESARLRCLCGVFLHYLVGNEPEATVFVHQLRRLSQRLLPTPLDVDTCFLTGMALAGSVPESHRMGLVRGGLGFWKCLRDFKRFHQVAPVQTMGRMLLLEVQSDRFRGDDIRAWSRCMVAIDRALSEGQSLVAAIGYELAATIVSRQGLATLVPDLLRSAHGSYQKCGVQAIVQPLVEAAVGVDGTVEGRPQSLESRRNTELSRVIELSREISRELRFERLLHKLVTVLIRDVGGQRCLVLLRQGDVWQVEAEGRDDAATITTPALPAADYREIPWVFISSVIDSHERCVLVDAAASREADPDFLRRGVRSVLCAPILHQGLLRGILYLEDCQHPGVYTYERVQLLGQLTAQISSSIENARLFHDLDTVRDAALLAERAKTRFLLNLSHELRTPLNAVIGYTELIEEEIEDGDTESASEDLASICTATQRLQRTLSSIYALSQIESGRVETDEDDVNVHELLIAVRAKYLPGVEARGLEMGWQLDALDYPFVTDAEKLNYCLMSLVDNASRFTQRGCVRVLASMSVIQGRRWLRVEVSDTGIGISEAEQSTLFDAFRQVDDSTTRAHEGAGVSLAVTREFCHLLGGRLDFQSELGVGSTFTLEIPTLKSQHFARARSASLA